MFAAGPGLPDPPAIESTTVSQGKLAEIYDGTSITDFINDGTGWQPLGTPYSPPSTWGYPPGSYPWGAPSQPFLLFQLDAEVQVAPVPAPPSSGLFGIGLLGIGFLAIRKARHTTDSWAST